MIPSHIPFAEATWIDVGGGVQMAPLRVVGAGAGVAYLRFEAGGRAGAHRHPGGEDLYVISGSLRVGDRELDAGDYLHTPPGGVHDAVAPDGALVLVAVAEPIEFLDNQAPAS